MAKPSSERMHSKGDKMRNIRGRKGGGGRRNRVRQSKEKEVNEEKIKYMNVQLVSQAWSSWTMSSLCSCNGLNILIYRV